MAVIEGEWDALADQVGSVPWLRPGWLQAWWPAFGTGRLEIVTARRGADLAAVLPVRRHLGRLSSPTNWHSPQFGILAADHAARDAVLDDIFNERPRSLNLHLLDAHEGDVQAVAAAAQRAGYRVMAREELRSPCVPTTGDMEEYVKAQREGRKVAKELRRQTRRLSQEGEIAFRTERGADRLSELLDLAFTLEGSGWKARRGTAIASQDDVRRFYEDVARWSAARGTLRLAFLDVDGRPIAFDLLVEDNRRAYDLKGGYDETFRPFGPGKLLLREMLVRVR